MADQNITALPEVTSPAGTDQLLLVGAAEEQLIDYEKLADAILNKLTSKTYALDAGTQTLIAALNSLNSNIVNKGIYNGDLDEITMSRNMISVYRAGYNCANSPVENSYGIVKTIYIDGGDYAIQEFVSLTTGYYYIRLKLNGIWSKWYTHAHTGILNDLTTTAKNNLVSAVNEVNGRIYQKMLGTSLLEYAQTCAYGFSTVYLTGASYGGSDLPGSNYAYGSAMILKRADTAINVVLFPESSYFKVAINSYNGSWSGWKDFAGNSIT